MTPPIVNQCHPDDIASYDPEYLGGQVSSAEMINSVEPPPSVNPGPSTEPQVPYVLGLLASPRFQIPSALKEIESFVQVGKQVARPMASVVETVGTAGAALWSGVGALFGAGLGIFSAGPAPALMAAAIPQGMDYTSDKLQRLGLKPEEIYVLTSRLTESPERPRLIYEALSQPTVPEQREALRAAISIMLPPGETLLIRDEQGNILGQYTHDPQKGIISAPANVEGESHKEGTCPSDMVLVPSGRNRKQVFHAALCVDQKLYTDRSDRMPKVDVSFHEAAQICTSQQRRLPTFEEYYWYASDRDTKEYPTLDGTSNGIHYNALGPRSVDYVSHNFVKYGGKALHDGTGNVWQFLADGNIGGGAWHYLNEGRVEAGSHMFFEFEQYNGDFDVGLRCVSSPQDSKK